MVRNNEAPYQNGSCLPKGSSVQKGEAGNVRKVASGVVLIAFYNQNAIGVRCLERALKTAGYGVKIVFFKDYHSKTPSLPDKKELRLLCQLVRRENPLFVGLSVMSTLYLEAVSLVNRVLKECAIPLVWGGVYPTMFPERAMKEADFVLRGEGELPIVELCRALEGELPLSRVGNLVYQEKGKILHNPMYPLTEDLDTLSYPDIGGDNKLVIENRRVSTGDPAARKLGYETAASRGCPYACSYCCSVNLKRIYTGKYVRLRSPDHVIEELMTAKERMKRLSFVHFWDEIFSEDLDWVRAFSAKYKEKIGLPFIIWAHPLKVDLRALRLLVDAGLYEVIMGIQSGSPRIRKDIFHRGETDEQIIQASKDLRRAGVPHVCYDFMLQHPFETQEDIQATFRLCNRLEPPFQLQLHGLNFLPGTDILREAETRGTLSLQELEPIMFGPMEVQYSTYWKRDAGRDSTFWYHLIYLTQFPLFKRRAMKLAVSHTKNFGQARRLFRLAGLAAKARYLRKKGGMLLKGSFSKLRRNMPHKD